MEADPEAEFCLEKIAASDAKREEANELFKKADYAGAAKLYSDALDMLEFVWDGQEETSKLKAQSKIFSLLNRALCFLKLNRADDAIEDCEHVLAIEEDNVKALFRRGNAYLLKKEYAQAEKDLKKALEQRPTDAKIKEMLAQVHAEQEAHPTKKRKET
eukprot:TRINITY_DN9033_c0_g1_i1.p1 TRINITY_DN9033_c0_g1~~TRINITY_DN9033_c0_g1_i1.p1  ORF type:complete len:169 (+),score=21.36 TRINITY_DN9033_c0_g1_i1:33-509(+)